jgi:hypothetical protein
MGKRTQIFLAMQGSNARGCYQTPGEGNRGDLLRGSTNDSSPRTFGRGLHFRIDQLFRLQPIPVEGGLI